MNVKISLLFLSCCFAAVIAMSILDSTDEEWEKYKRDFHKKYLPGEEVIRRKHFEHRMKYIHDHNKRFSRKEVSYKLGINQFTDVSDDEMKKNGRSKVHLQEDNDSKLNYDQDVIEDVNIDENFDWRSKGAVSGVKDQGSCEFSDYAFAAVGALEGQLFIKDKKLTELSEQDLIDCSKMYGNNGCDGGDVGKAIEYVKRHGILTETSYPFKGEESQTCPKKLRDGIAQGTIIECKYLGSKENEMKHKIFRNGPITAEINASPSFISYQGGIFTGEDCTPDEQNHNVLIVGYGVTTSNKSEKYWIVKNSWGETWGESGYATIERDKNTCGIANAIRYVNISST